MTTKGYIYLLKLGDTNNRIIYKVGKSINFYKRYKEYNYAVILHLCTFKTPILNSKLNI